MSVSAAKWLARQPQGLPTELTAASRYSQFSGKHGRLLPQLLWSRDQWNETFNVDQFLNPRLENLQSPFSIKNLELSAIRLSDAVEKNEKIAIYGDYDMDGMSGLSLLVSFFKSLGHQNIVHFQPHRFLDGYGVHAKSIRQLHADGAQIIVTVDTGSMAFEADDAAAQLGLAYIITDHHQCDANRNPQTPYFINPNQATDTSTLKYLSGAGVAFYLAMGVRAKLRERKYFETRDIPESNLLELLDLFSLGSIGDVVPLIGDNRVLVKFGLDKLRHTQRPGLRVLLDKVVEGKAKLSARDVAFSIVPKLNSASRMGQAELSTQLLLETDEQKAEEICAKIMELNTERSRLQKEAAIEAKAQALAAADRGDRVLVVSGNWHEGILGIVAAKVAEEFFRPAIVLALAHDSEGQEILRGSMRSPAPHHSLKILTLGKDFLLRFGGHQAAAGLALKPENLESFVQAVQAPFEGSVEDTEGVVYYDGVLEELPRFHEVKALENLEPLGAGNPDPVFLIQGFSVGDFEILKEAHIKAKKSGVEFIGFNLYKKLEAISATDAYVDLLVVPEISTFRFQEKAQLRIQAIRPSATKKGLANESSRSL